MNYRIINYLVIPQFYPLHHFTAPCCRRPCRCRRCRSWRQRTCRSPRSSCSWWFGISWEITKEKTNIYTYVDINIYIRYIYISYVHRFIRSFIIMSDIDIWEYMRIFVPYLCLQKLAGTSIKPSGMTYHKWFVWISQMGHVWWKPNCKKPSLQLCNCWFINPIKTSIYYSYIYHFYHRIQPLWLARCPNAAQCCEPEKAKVTASHKHIGIWTTKNHDCIHTSE